jgi:general secretion pathway protein K
MNGGLFSFANRVGRHGAARQRGAALLTAMIIVTLVGALDWARLILREDARAAGSKPLDHLGEPWAVPLAEARLSTFLAVDRSNTEDAPDAFLSGRIVDAQARYNLRNLVDRDRIIEVEQRALERLCEAAGVAPELAARLAHALRDALAQESMAASPDADTPLIPRTVAQLAWLGVESEALTRLRPYVVLLPQHTTLNLNTAQREVIAAVIEGADLGSAERLVQSRQRNPIQSFEAAKALFPAGVLLDRDSARVGVSSSYFEVHGRLRLGDRALEQRSLVERRGIEIVQLRRERVSLQESLQ